MSRCSGLSVDRNSGHGKLALWRNVLLDIVRGDAPDLTARQMALLMTVYLTPGPHTVRGLAATLCIGKPAVTRALDTLCALDFLRRKRDTKDRRNVLIQRTVAGSVYLSEFGDRIAEHAEERGGVVSSSTDAAPCQTQTAA